MIGRRMNIIYDNVIYNLQKFGGISVYWSQLSRRIIKDSSVKTIFLEFDKNNKNISRDFLNIDSSRIIKNNIRFGLVIDRYFNPRNVLTKNTIFHSSYYRFNKNKKAINVVTVYDFTYEKYIRTIKGRIHILQKRRALFKADGIICISENTKNDMLKLYPKLSKKAIKVIYLAHNSEDFYHNGAKKDLNSVLFVGSRTKYKNFDYAVKIVSGIDKCKLLISGNPLTEEETSLLKRELPDRFEVYPYASTEELNLLYNKSLCLLYLSEYEGFGIPVLEAMSSGCPVICLNKSSIPEVAKNAGIMFDKLDIVNIQDSIIKLRENSKYRLSIIQSGFENIEFFSWEKCYKETIDFYQKLIER